MGQRKLDFNVPIQERVTPAKGSIYPFSKHATDWAFIAFLERVNDRWDSDVPDEEQEAEEAPALEEETIIINAMLKAQAERLSQIAQEATQNAPQAIKSGKAGAVHRKRR